MTPGIFVTGTNTGVGKTLVAAALTHALAKDGYRVVGLKPIASGSTPDSTGRLLNPDALALQAASSVRLPYELVNPYCFEPGIAPHLAAEEAQQVIAVDDLVAWYGRATADADIAIVEGAGGWRVPLHPLGFLSDLPEQLGLSAVLVVGLTLGCLNHARLTFESIQHAGCAPFLGWIGNRVDPGFQRLEGNLHTLERLLGGPPLAIIPPLGPTAGPAEAAEFLAGPLTRAAVAPLLRAARLR